MTKQVAERNYYSEGRSLGMTLGIFEFILAKAAFEAVRSPWTLYTWIKREENREEYFQDSLFKFFMYAVLIVATVLSAGGLLLWLIAGNPWVFIGVAGTWLVAAFVLSAIITFMEIFCEYPEQVEEGFE